MTYIEQRAEAIRALVPSEDLPSGDTRSLFLMYAALSFSKGKRTAASDVHDAWSAWAAITNPEHESIVPFPELDTDVAAKDEVFVRAIRESVGEDDFETRLFPAGLPIEDHAQALDLYKMMVGTSEALVARRQSVNTFFLTATGVLLTALGWMVGGGAAILAKQASLVLIGFTGFAFALSWRSLLISFGQLNRGKFHVINRIEQELSVAPFDAEWLALEEGRNPKVYRSFTSREVWVPMAFMVVYGALALAGVAWDLCGSHAG